MNPAGKPLWQRVTALVSLSTGGAVTGFSFVPGAVADIAAPTSLPIRLMALEKSVQPAASDDALLRSAIVNVASYYLKMAEGKTPAEMEQIIWQQDSLDGVDHGASCAAFASLTLELGAQVVGQQSWVTGGTSYPWPLHKWADVRVDPNPSSLGITSILQDAQANNRWHPLGDGYQPMPGDWVLFDDHVEVVTAYVSGTLYTIGGDSGANLSVNAHEYAGPLGAQGVAGFVNNGQISAAEGQSSASADPASAAPGPQAQAAQPQGPDAGQPGRAGRSREHAAQPQERAAQGQAAIPGATPAPMPGSRAQAPGSWALAPGPRAQAPASRAQAPASRAQAPASRAHAPRRLRHVPGRRSHASIQAQAPGAGADVPGTGPSLPAAAPQTATPGSAAVPGLPAAAHHRHAEPRSAPGTAQSQAGRSLHGPASAAAGTQRSFIDSVAPGAMAAQRKYGVPAAVTIAQAIEESGWGQSGLAVRDHNLFGIKGQGPAGSDMLPTQEFENGQMVNRTAIFRVYHNFAESIDDHGKLLATSGYYRQAMAERLDPNKFAASLTGVYATDPAYGDKLIAIMQQYDLYRYDAGQDPAAAAGATAPASSAGEASIPGLPPHPDPAPSIAQPQRVRPGHQLHHRRRAGHDNRPLPVRTPPPGQSPRAQPTPAPEPAPARPAAPAPGRSSAPSRPRPTQPPAIQLVSDIRVAAALGRPAVGRPSRLAGAPARHYRHHLPLSVRSALQATARGPIRHAESLYRDVASHSGIRWELLAACDWMQCDARPRYSPVHGEKLGTLNPDGTIYHTKSESLEQVADDLIDLAGAVYEIDLTSPSPLSVRDLANVFAAFRWGGLLRLHRTSAMEFPYSVAGLTDHHTNMRWPNIDEPNAPDRPGARFHRPFGAVPVVLGLNYPAVD